LVGKTLFQKIVTAAFGNEGFGGGREGVGHGVEVSVRGWRQ
jgi:hypothetical protein